MGKYIHVGRVLQETTYLLQETIIHRMTRKIKSKLDGKFFFIDYDFLGIHSKWNHSKISLLIHGEQ